MYVNIGETLEWGFPVGNNTDAWLHYPEAIHNKHPSVVLVDGRFRVACVLQTLLTVSHHDLRIIVHDFFNRPYYHEILQVVDLIHCVDSLAVFKPKSRFKSSELADLYRKYSHDPQ